MANLLNLLRKKRLDQYNQAMQSSPFRPIMSTGEIWGDQESKRAQLLLANPDDLDLNTQIAKLRGPSAQFSEAYYSQGPKYDSSLVGEQGVYDLNNPYLGTVYTDAPLTGTDKIYKDRKDEKGLDYEGMLKALEKHESAGPAGWASMGKPGGTGGGGFKLFPNSMVDNRTPIGPFDEDEQRKRWWAMYGNIA
jgi:hypothetical protein